MESGMLLVYFMLYDIYFLVTKRIAFMPIQQADDLLEGYLAQLTLVCIMLIVIDFGNSF